MWVLCLTLLLGVVARDHGPSAPLKHNRSPHHSKVTRSHRHGRFHMKFSVSQNKEVDLELEPNNNLLTSDYEEREILPDGSSVVVRTGAQIPQCWFRGKIVGDEESDVIASDCDGFEGVIRTGDGKSHIARAGATNDDVSVHSLEDEEEYHGACGVPHNGHPATSHGHLEEQTQTLPTIPPAGRKLLVTNTSVNVVEVAFVSDNGYLRARGGPYGRNLTAVAQLNVQIMNIVQATYLNTPFAKPTSVQLKAQFFFSGQDPYTVSEDGNGEVDQNVLLNSFNTWMKTNLPNKEQFDHAHLLTYYDLLADTVGFAFTEAICNTDSFSAISEASNTVLRVANTVAHELGHVLGMNHDQPPSCPLGHVMAATNSCPTAGLCSFSTCSITAKDTYAGGMACLSTWDENGCSDGKWNGQETAIDCGGPICPACTATGCDVNNGGCEQTCTPLGTTSYVCECDSTTYVDPTDGVTCVTDVNQCTLPTSPCDENCTNILAPGGVYKSFECSCSVDDNVLSAVDGVTCAPPSCFDGIKNQDEVMIDCGGVCFPYCGCLVSTVSWPSYAYDRGFSLNNAQWRSRAYNHYELIKFGVPVRYVYKTDSVDSEWVYDSDDNVTTGYYGILRGAPSAPSGTNWQIFTGVGSTFATQTITFKPCSTVTVSTCGNGILEGDEMCETCLVYSGGVCVVPNPCCDSTCLAPRPRGFSCSDQHSLQGACWDGECITRESSCSVISTANCFGSLSNCIVATGGQDCGAVEEPFSSTSCDAPIKCYINCLGTTLDNPADPIGATRGFPCSTMNADGTYPSVCSGGPTGNGKGGSECTAVGVLSARLYSNFSKAPTSAPSVAGSPTPTEEGLSGAGTLVVGISVLLVLLSPGSM